MVARGICILIGLNGGSVRTGRGSCGIRTCQRKLRRRKGAVRGLCSGSSRALIHSNLPFAVVVGHLVWLMQEDAWEDAEELD
jgi:hypothetical protein